MRSMAWVKENYPCSSKVVVLGIIACTLPGQRSRASPEDTAVSGRARPGWLRKRTGGLTCSATIQGIELAQPSIGVTCELLECEKGLALQKESRRISVAQGHDRVSEKRPSGHPVLIVFQKPGASNQTNDSLQ